MDDTPPMDVCPPGFSRPTPVPPARRQTRPSADDGGRQLDKSDMLLHVFSSGGAGVGRRARQRGGIGHCISTIFTRRKGTSQQYPSRTVDE
jgi:hypothetical protein